MNDGWDGILDDDEHILWQGRPFDGFRFDFSQPHLLAMGVVLIGFSIFWMQMAARGGGYFWTFGLLIFGIGIFNAIGIHFWKTYVRRNTYYTLTSKNAFIATNLFGRKSLKTYHIENSTDLEFFDGPTQTIVFAKVTKRGKHGSYQVPVGFEFIHDGRDVMKLLRGVQEGHA